MTKATAPKLPAYDFHADGVTQGLLMKWKECHQRAKLYLQRWSPNRVSSSLLYGVLMHDVLHRVHDWQQANKLAAPTHEFVDKAVAESIAAYRLQERARVSRWSAEQEQEFEFLSAQLYAVAYPYFEHYRRKPLAWQSVENTFSIRYAFGPGPDDWTLLRGRFDGVYKIRNESWLFDAKNKAMINEEQFGEVLLRDWQVNFYLLALLKQSGVMPSGFTYNVMRRPGLKLNQKETLPQHIERIRKHIAEKGGDYYFNRYDVSVVREDLDAFEHELREVLVEFKAWLDAGMPTHLFGQPCIAKFGLCEFVPMDFNNSLAPYHKREVMFNELVEAS